jgi:hypothetical protein
MWLRMGTSGGSFEDGNERLNSIKPYVIIQ